MTLTSSLCSRLSICCIQELRPGTGSPTGAVLFFPTGLLLRSWLKLKKWLTCACQKLKRNFLQSLALGEASSEVANILSNVSKLYAQENEDRLKILLSLLEPFMMLFIGTIVGVIVSAMLLPIFTMTQGLK